MNSVPDAIQGLKNGLIVSCQAQALSPLDDPRILAALARVAEQEGAVGVRINGTKNIRAVRRRIEIPIIGIEKQTAGDSAVYITPTLDSARRVHSAGAGIVALDATGRPRPNGESLAEIIKALKRHTQALIVADVATVDQGFFAAGIGVDAVATTLHGYTHDTEAQSGNEPAFNVLRELAKHLALPVILEGRVRHPDDLRKGFDLGAHAVVVGTAITNIGWLVRPFVEATPKARSRSAAFRAKKMHLADTNKRGREER